MHNPEHSIDPTITFNPDSDRPVATRESDHFGFAGIAERLAPSILMASKSDGMVIGLEGIWGSGKTSLLNLLREELNRKKASNTYVISISPWLSGDKSNLVKSLLDPVAEILEKIEQAKDQDRNAKKSTRFFRSAKRKSTELGKMVRAYGVRTGRTLAPAVRFAEYFVPGSKIVADAAELGAEYLEKFDRHATTAETKEDITKKISELAVSFIVIIDDLDRLEPYQAVEVVRLVRSVADFPRIAYLMCYDRSVLAQALKHALNIDDGDHFLQKIVQLTFALPLPEPFDLRTSFLEEAKIIYKTVNKSELSSDILEDLKWAVDRQGGALQTPREVKLALNGIRFIYPSISDDVYFPDLCRLFLIKTTFPKLYRWMEEYLSLRSVLVTNDASIGNSEKSELGDRLTELLPIEESDSTRSIWNLRLFIPGVKYHKDAKERVFGSTSLEEVRKLISMKRLGSPIHYRFYFALTAPKNVMPDRDFAALLALARTDVSELTEKLKAYADQIRVSGKSWFEHILDRLDTAQIGALDTAAAEGLAVGIANSMDSVLSKRSEPRPFTISVETHARIVVRDCLKQIRASDRQRFMEISRNLVSNSISLNWLVGTFIRTELRQHGIAGERSSQPEDWLFSDSELEELRAALGSRTSTSETQNQISEMPDVSAYLFGWRDLSGSEPVTAWVQEYAESNKGFLDLLQHLRSWALSDRVYYPLHRSSVTAFFDWEQVLERLDDLSHTEFAEKVSDIQLAIKQGENH
ncbi:KAP family P-loop NTPase fold protein [Phyllobacterium chamaecytisi]|uniref:KAP family P-loop NTPase fold protein n=1 Tax=Phyllobacterium chamaecytisi TaxID=2876082 RepID=UPI001CCF739B|nr:P-loop NTPase fold protein [Phyllobacterium sp. KW56]MBZ9600495.1 KAP family NTPase [Phyllobacterium sp. KW56]